MKNILTKILLGFVFMLISSSIVLACRAAPGDLWFNEVFSYKIILNDQFSTPAAKIYTENGRSFIYNDTKIPSYIVKNDPGLDVENLKDLPKDYRPFYKLVDNKVYYWDWNYENSKWNLYSEDKLFLDDIVYEVSDFSQSTKQLMADNRPDDVVIPQTAIANAILLSDGMEEVLRIEAKYSLNEKYNSRAGAEGLEFCANWSANSGSPIPLDENDMGTVSWWDRIIESVGEFFANLF